MLNWVDYSIPLRSRAGFQLKLSNGFLCEILKEPRGFLYGFSWRLATSPKHQMEGLYMIFLRDSSWITLCILIGELGSSRVPLWILIGV